MNIALMTLAECTTRSGLKDQKSSSVRTANETRPARFSAHARASLTCGRQLGGASAAAGAAAVSRARAAKRGAARRTARESTLPPRVRGALPAHADAEGARGAPGPGGARDVP